MPPAVDAGQDRFTFDSNAVTLTGFANDSDGTIVSDQWSQVAGTPVAVDGITTSSFVSLDGVTTSSLHFTPPPVTDTLTFNLTVTDNAGAQRSDSVSVYVGKVLLTDSFETASNWIYRNDTVNPVSWSAVGGELLQVNNVFTNAYQESYHLGTYAYLDPTVFPKRTAFRFSVDVIPQTNYDDTREGNDVGIMFPYADANNYYRLSMSSRYGFTRLEKRQNGGFRTLGVNSIGYVDNQPFNVTVEINTDTLIVWIDEDPIFAVVDSSLSPGTIALYCQDKASFDNLIISENSPQPMVAVLSPLAHSVALTPRDGNALSVQAVTLNPPADGRVVFTLDGANETVSTLAGNMYTAQFSPVSDGDHEIAAILRDADGNELSRDINTVVGVGGNYIITVGDSITNGIGDENPLNNDSMDGRIVSRQGFQAGLADGLTILTNRPQIVFNEGIGADMSIDTDIQRIDSILERHPGANEMLLLIGTNDALNNRSDVDFDGNLRNIVNTARTDVDRVYIALIPPVYLPSPDAANNRIINYNTNITAFINGDPLKDINIFLGPDFYARFLNNFDSLYADSLHPNDAGYQAMAGDWRNTLLSSQ